MVDVKVELQELKEEFDSQASASSGAAVAKRRSRRRHMAWAAGGILVVAAGAAVTLWRLRRPELPPPTVVKLSLERFAGSGSFSPEGTQIAFRRLVSGSARIYLVSPLGGSARRLSDFPARGPQASWSPDRPPARLPRPVDPEAVGLRPLLAERREPRPRNPADLSASPGLPGLRPRDLDRPDGAIQSTSRTIPHPR
jgi:hypothetical protein